jgi:hypothetical protein
MDPVILSYILAGIAGWGGGALAHRDPSDYPPKGPCPKCPYPAGAVAGLILWGMTGLEGGMADVAVPAVLVGLAGGLFGGSLVYFVGLFRGR